MAYDHYEARRSWREPRSRFGSDDDRRNPERDRDDERERGFFERAGDEVASWFGDDEAERRRREDTGRFGEDSNWRRSRSFGGDDEYSRGSSRYDRQARFRDEGYRRPYTGRSMGRGGFGDSDQYDRSYPPERGWSAERRDYQGATTGVHDPHYSEWRRRQVEELDRDYDDYRRENQSRFESDFTNWRTQRQGKRQLLAQVREQMSVVGSDDEPVGTVDCVRGDRIILTKDGSDDNRHHALNCSLVDRVEGDRVVLDRPAAETKSQITSEDRGFFRDDDEREGGRMLNRAFSRTYER